MPHHEWGNYRNNNKGNKDIVATMLKKIWQTDRHGQAHKGFFAYAKA
jgi:hypothetical protein